MVSPQVSDAYAALGLEQGASIESVKTAYKQIALRIHPDKNLDNPDATAEFQRVSEAYRVLVKHIERPEPQHQHHHHHHHHHGFSFSGHPFYSPFDEADYDDEEDDYDYDDEYDDYDEDEEIQFFMYLFFNAARRQHMRDAHRNHHHHRVDEESPEHYKARVQRARDEQIASEERRKREAAFRKERIAKEKEEERVQAEQRQKKKAQAKKAQAEASRKAASDKAKELKRKSQATRSAVFAAARAGQSDKVKNGVYKDSVDASGGEVAHGCEEFVKGNVANPRETLLHITARLGDLELVKWLESHGAEQDERDSDDLTAFQVALKVGHLPIVQYILEAFPPKDADHKAIYTAPEDSSLLSLAISSCEPQLVYIILENKLATIEDMKTTWTFVSSAKGQQTLAGAKPTAARKEKADDIVKLVAQYGGFSQQKPAPARSNEQAQKAPPSPAPSTQGQTSERSQTPNQRGSYRGKPNGYRGRGRGKFRGNSRPDV